MSRLSATLRLDARLQARNKVYLIVAMAAVGIASVLRWAFAPEQLHFFMPLVVLGGVTPTTAFLVGVLVQLERGEGTLEAVRVSPLRPAEYLASKMIALSALALIEGALIAGIAYGLDFRFPWLVLAVLLRATLGVAVGVAVAVRYRSMMRFILPAIAVSAAFDLPNLWYLGLWPSPLFYAWPTLPSLLLAKAAFQPVEPLHLVYASVYGALAMGGALFWALAAIDRFVVRGEAGP